jgi:hypothetical protein
VYRFASPKELHFNTLERNEALMLRTLTQPMYSLQCMRCVLEERHSLNQEEIHMWLEDLCKLRVTLPHLVIFHTLSLLIAALMGFQAQCNQSNKLCNRPNSDFKRKAECAEACTGNVGDKWGSDSDAAREF